MNGHRSPTLRRALWCVLFLALAIFDVRAGDETDAAFSQANQLYEQGKFAEAATAYDRLLTAGQGSAWVYYNFGNALFKQGRIGRAIVAYRRGLRLAPRDRDLRANLLFARLQARGGSTYPPESLDRWLGVLTLNEWSAAAMLAFWMAAGLFALGEWRPETARRLRGVRLAAMLATVLLGGIVLARWRAEYGIPTAVALLGEVDVRTSPLDVAQVVYKVRDGVELRVLDRLHNWFQVEDPARRLGWVRGDQVQLLDEPATPAASAPAPAPGAAVTPAQ